MVLARARRWDAFWVRLLMGSGGGIYVDRELVRWVTKGTNALLPAAISRPGKVTWRAWPATTLRSQWSSQAIAILHLVLVAVVLCRILGSVGGGGRGRSFPPPGCLFSLMGPLILMVVRQQRQKLAGCVLGSCPGAGGAWVLGRGSLRGVLSPPSCCGLAWALCFPALGRPAKSFLLEFCTVRRLGIKEIVTWDPSLACPLGGGERYRLASVMIFRRPVYESSESSHFG